MKKALWGLIVLCGLGGLFLLQKNETANLWAEDSYNTALLTNTTAYTGSNYCTGIYICNPTTSAVTISIKDYINTTPSTRAQIYCAATNYVNIDFAGQGHITNTGSLVYLSDQNLASVGVTVFYKQR